MTIEQMDIRTPGQAAFTVYVDSQIPQILWDKCTDAGRTEWEKVAQAAIAHHRKTMMVTEKDMERAEDAYDALAGSSDDALCDREHLRAAITAALEVMP